MWKWKSLSRVLLFMTPMDYIGHNTGVGSSQPRDQTQVSCTSGGFITSWATGEAQYSAQYIPNAK